MSRIKAIQVEEKTWEEFKELANEEGRVFGKMLAVLVEKYKEVNSVSANKKHA